MTIFGKLSQLKSASVVVIGGAAVCDSAVSPRKSSGQDNAPEVDDLRGILGNYPTFINASEGVEAASYPSAAATQPAEPAERNTARLHRARCRLHRPPLHS